jgi:deazaflavin-dependent oxidoreductase (nitroreductase family)
VVQRDYEVATTFTLHTIISGNMLLVTVVGRKSGKPYMTPVSYLRDGDALLVTSLRGRTWWRNLRGGAPVTVRLTRQEQQAYGEVTEDRRAVAADLLAFLQYAPHLARYYGVYLNRWIQPDTIVPEPGNPQSLNRFSYSYNNPVRYTDPTGHKPCSDDPEECQIYPWWYTGRKFSEKIRRRNIARYTQSVLRLKDAGTIDDVEALARIMDFAAGGGASTQEWANDISSILVGGEGPFTLITSVGALVRGYSAPAFKDTGFHKFYQDADNQVYHLWAYVNTTVQGGDQGLGLGTVANVYHEYFEVLEPLVQGKVVRGASYQDEALAYRGLYLGLDLYHGRLTPNTAGDAFRQALRTYNLDVNLAQKQIAENPTRPSNRFADWLWGK